MPSRKRFNPRTGWLVLVLLLFGCREQNIYVEPPPPKVTVARPQVQDVVDYLEFTGTTEASERVEIRARVTGILESMDFEVGTFIDAGQRLFVIDPREYQAQLKAAEAERAAGQAQLTLAQIELQRAERLFAQAAGSEADVVQWRGKKEEAQAAILRAEARIEQAKLNLEYTDVKAPVSGRVGRNLVDVGNLVGSAEATMLTEITRFDPMFVYFALNERDYLRVLSIYREKVREKGIDPATTTAREAEVPIELGLANESGYPHQGVLDFAESGLDPDTGSLQLRAAFENKEQPPLLAPGLFARIRMPYATRADLPLVTDRAIGADQSGSYVLVVVDRDGKRIVEKRGVQLGRLMDGLRVIEAGVTPEDWVIVNGLQRARPNGEVDPDQVEMASLATSNRLAEARPQGAAPGSAAAEVEPPGEQEASPAPGD